MYGLEIIIRRSFPSEGELCAQYRVDSSASVMPGADSHALNAALDAVCSDTLIREEWRSLVLKVEDMLLSKVVDPEGASVQICYDEMHGFYFSVGRALCTRTGFATSVEEIPGALMALIGHVAISEEAYKEVVELNASAPSIEDDDFDDGVATDGVLQNASHSDEFCDVTEAFLNSPETATMADLLHILKLDPSNDLTFAQMSGVDFGEVDLAGYNFEGANLSYCDFSRAKIDKMNYDGADITGAKWPSGYIACSQNGGKWVTP
jgi:hypothetical protein